MKSNFIYKFEVVFFCVTLFCMVLSFELQDPILYGSSFEVFFWYFMHAIKNMTTINGTPKMLYRCIHSKKSQSAQGAILFQRLCFFNFETWPPCFG